jgi:CRP-like cAMP-binding protein
MAFLRNVKLFEELRDFSLDKIVNVMFLVTFSPGDRIFKQGEMGDCFYMIQSGKVAITQSTFLGTHSLTHWLTYSLTF